ncbi:RsmB/NOP family class I SAM-dependent RNA methyltransferase [Spirochaetia bacterium 38H-sp]|uniref:NOL1/NOP2/Sun domain family member 4 n=1 Tax=Rarispira pelagica TaxID=3141764 RepID=A0ABU9UAZ8_9SPIR
MAKNKKTAEQEFYTYYRELYHQRWEKLESAIKTLENYYPIKIGKKEYYIDKASAYPVIALNIQQGNNILDMCAAPGGKTLLIAERLNGTGTLTANEKSPARKARLDKVLSEHLPEELRKNIHTTCRDAEKWGLYQQNTYDRILVDVPCSSEAHLIKNPKELKKWTKSRSKNLAIKQYAILSSAFMALAKGGYIVYSTCALSPLENDKTIEKLIKKHGKKLRILELQNTTDIPKQIKLQLIEKTEYGYHILPDKNKGAGPIYFCIIEKTEETQAPAKKR